MSRGPKKAPAIPCPNDCDCEHGLDIEHQDGGCKSVATCPCGTEVPNDYDCIFFKQATDKIGQNDFLRKISSSARRIELVGCGLKHIPDGALSHLKNTRVLNLEYNGLTQVGSHLFNGMTRLKVLSLRGHHLYEEDADENEYYAMEPVKNQITSIEADAFSSNKNLVVLDLRNNNLTSFSDNVFEVPAKTLRVLKLVDNSLNLTKGAGPLASLHDVKQLDLTIDTGDRLETWMEERGHLLDDENGDASKWWEQKLETNDDIPFPENVDDKHKEESSAEPADEAGAAQDSPDENAEEGIPETETKEDL